MRNDHGITMAMNGMIMGYFHGIFSWDIFMGYFGGKTMPEPSHDWATGLNHPVVMDDHDAWY